MTIIRRTTDTYYDGAGAGTVLSDLGGGGGLETEVVTSATNIADGKLYVLNSASEIAFTLPATMAVGFSFGIMMNSTGTFTIKSNASATAQKITMYGTDSVASSSSNIVLATSSADSQVTCVCTTVNADLAVVDYVGTITLTEPASKDFQGSLKGYGAGGWAGGAVTTIDQFNFATDTSYTSTATLNTAKRAAAGLCGSTYGWIAGGVVSGAVTQVDKITFSNDTTALSPESLQVGVTGSAEGSDKVLGAGWMMGGGTSSAVASIEKIVFSSGVTSTITATLGTAKRNMHGITATGKSYAPGGYTSTQVKDVDKLTHSTEAMTNDVLELSDVRDQYGGASSSTDGYTMGGYESGFTAKVEKFNFTSEANATSPSNLDVAIMGHASVSGVSAGYAMGGEWSGGYSDDTAKLIHSSDATSVIAAVLSADNDWITTVQI